MEQQQQPSGRADHGNEATSRLCVKNIPKYLNEQRLKDHFCAKGQVTDVKILKTRDGHSRQMAFVGYRSVEDATTALQYFQNTYIDTSKLNIEYARRYRAPGAAADASAAAAAAQDKEHRPWSKYSEGSSRHQQLVTKQQASAAAAAAAASTDPKAAAKAARAARKAAKAAQKAAKKSAVDAAAEHDAKLAEFFQLMQPRSKAKIWTNDELLPGAVAAAVAEGSGPKSFTAGTADADQEADELYVQLPEAKQQQLGGSKHKAAADNIQESEPESEQEGEETDPLAGKDDVIVDEGVSDLDYLKARMRKTLDSELPQLQHQDGEDEIMSSSSESEVDSEDTDMRDASQDNSDDSGLQERGDQGLSLEEGDQGSDDADEGEGDQFDAAARGNQDGVGTSDAAAAAAAAAGGWGSAELEVLETGRLFVRNLSYAATEADLSELFGGFGTLEMVHLVLDRETKRSRGIAYVKFLLPEDALAAYKALDMSPFQGRLLHVLPAKKQPGEDNPAAAAAAAAAAQADDHGDDDSSKPSSFKAQRELQRKGDAGNRAAWSSLFMRADTVAAAVAAHYGVSKAQLLDPSASDLPLRMALGEAQVIAQTKAALGDAGINISALEAAAAVSGKAAAKQSVARSSTTLLVKNLPHSSDADELQHLFSGVGRSVVRLVLPPTKTLALVEFAEPQEARSAFKSLAYKKYQQVPLYLEWAPKDIWDAAAPAAAAATGAKSKVSDQPAAAGAGAGLGRSDADQHAGAAEDKSNVTDHTAAAADADGGEDESRPAACIYVKNINFATTEASLLKHFDQAVSAAGGRIHSAKVARRKGSDGKLLSMGFGFVETDSEASAKAAIKSLQGSMLDKHKLQLQLSKHGASGAAASAQASKAAAAAAAKKAAASKAAGTKLVVRNVAFEATRKDVLGLFGPFGHIKSCRLPKKFDGNHRGFAFLEFTTKQEAKNALDGAGGTHLYGRRLVMEYAQAEDESAGLDELRAKTAAKFAAGEDEALEEAPAPKRLKKTL